MNLLFLPACLFILLLCPTVAIADNHSIARLTLVSLLLILVQRRHVLKLELHHKLFLAWLAWAAIGAAYSEYPWLAFYGFYPLRGDGLVTWVIITAIGLLYWNVYRTLKPLAWTCLLMLLTLVVAHFFIVKRSTPDMVMQSQNYFDSVFVPPVTVGSFACQASVIMAILCPALAVFGIFPILDAASRIGLAALAFGGGSALLYGYRKHITAKVIVRALACVVLALATSSWWVGPLHLEQKMVKIPALPSGQLGARPQWILQASALASRLPLTGFGLDTLSEYLEPAKGPGFTDLERFTNDKVHCWAFDTILMTGWIGYTLLLLAGGWALAIAIKFPVEQNVYCACALGAFLIFGCANPHGLIGNIIAVMALFGIREGES